MSNSNDTLLETKDPLIELAEGFSVRKSHIAAYFECTGDLRETHTIFHLGSSGLMAESSVTKRVNLPYHEAKRILEGLTT